MPRAKARTPELRRRILDAAVQVLQDEGAPAVTTRHVAQRAGTSAPALYELFDDKAGLVRELFFEGHRRLGAALDALRVTADPVADVRGALEAFRRFATENAGLFDVMYAQPFEVFEPNVDDRRRGARSQRLVLERIDRAIGAGRLAGDTVDVAHVMMALAIGLARQENAGLLGGSRATCTRRWRLAVDAVLAGLAPDGEGPVGVRRRDGSAASPGSAPPPPR